MKELNLPFLPAGTEGLAGYEYLLRMRVDRLKAKAVKDLEEELVTLKAVRAELAAKTPESLWLTDLDAFSVAFDKFQAVRETGRASESMDATKTKVKAKTKTIMKTKAPVKTKTSA
jgi:hypothetical protein